MSRTATAVVQPTAKAAIYLRVSTKEQAEMGGEREGYSIPAQREACLRKAETLGAMVSDEFVDRGESAKSADRPELQRLLQYVKAEAISYVIVHKVDRLARNRLDDVQINLAFKAAGAQLVSCTESIDDTPSGMLVHGIMSTIAEFYSRNLANEVIKGSVQKAKNGGTIGRAPTGYLNHRLYENGREIRTVIVDPVRGPLMAEAFELYASSEWTIRTLLEELTMRGLNSAPSKNRASKPLSLSNFLHLLRHPYYKGLVRYRGVEYPGKHQPLVTEAVWRQVQDVLTAQNFAGEKKRLHHQYLKGTVWCGECGSRLIVTNAKGRGGVYPYFVCIGRQQKRTTCQQSAVLIDVVEAKVEELYASLQPPATLVDEIRAVLLHEMARNTKAAEKEQRIQEKCKNRLEAERYKLLEGHYAGAIPLDLLKSEQQRITHELEQVARRSADLTTEAKTVEANLGKALALAANWHGAYLQAGPADRRQLNQVIFEKLYVTQDYDVRHTFNEPFALLLSPEVTTMAMKRYRLTNEQSEAIDRAWEELSARWASEVRSTDLARDEYNPLVDNEGVVGLNVNCLVGDGGLEPSTSAV
jgi:site-specific DNA recombinase